MSNVENYLAFIKEVEGLKSVTRTAWTSTGRHESTAEHSWRLALMAGVLGEAFTDLNLEKVLLMCLIHDLGERYTGDISAASFPDEDEKYNKECETVGALFGLLPQTLSNKLFKLWKEYEDGESEEAMFVKSLDKLETIIQHNQGINPSDFDYAFNLTYGKQYLQNDTYLQQLRKLIDQETNEKIK